MQLQPMFGQNSEVNPVFQRRAGRPRTRPEKKRFKGDKKKNESYLPTLILSINRTDKGLLAQIAQSHDCKNISALNRALVRGELILLKLNTQEFNLVKAEALLQSFNSVEDYLIAIAKNSFPIPTTLQKPDIASQEPHSHAERKCEEPSTTINQISIHISESEQILLRALSFQHGFLVPSGKNTGIGSPTILNRNIAQGNLSLISLPPEILESLHLISKSYDFDKLEDFLLSLITEFKPNET